MTITKQMDSPNCTLAFVGQLDTTTAPLLEREMALITSEITSLTLDFAQLNYISSAGLRVILSLQKKMSKQGNMVVTHVNDAVQEVFEMTKFVDILTIE